MVQKLEEEKINAAISVLQLRSFLFSLSDYYYTRSILTLNVTAAQQGPREDATVLAFIAFARWRHLDVVTLVVRLI